MSFSRNKYLACFTFLLVTFSSKVTMAADWKTEYTNLLSTYLGSPTTPTLEKSTNLFALSDFNNDSVPELIIRSHGVLKEAVKYKNISEISIDSKFYTSDISDELYFYNDSKVNIAKDFLPKDKYNFKYQIIKHLTDDKLHIKYTKDFYKLDFDGQVFKIEKDFDTETTAYSYRYYNITKENIKKILDSWENEYIKRTKSIKIEINGKEINKIPPTKSNTSFTFVDFKDVAKLLEMQFTKENNKLILKSEMIKIELDKKDSNTYNYTYTDNFKIVGFNYSFGTKQASDYDAIPLELLQNIDSSLLMFDYPKNKIVFNTTPDKIDTTSLDTISNEKPVQPTPTENSNTMTIIPVKTTSPTQTPAKTISAYEFEENVVKLVNIERAKVGLAPLSNNSSLANIARLKSEDFTKNNYFSHTSPTYGTPFDMLKSFGIQYNTAGENIAAGQNTPEEVMKAWMNSPGHKENILTEAFGNIGVGYVKLTSGSNTSPYWTQLFTN